MRVKELLLSRQLILQLDSPLRVYEGLGDASAWLHQRGGVTCQDLVGIAWACCLVDSDDPELLQRLVESSESNLETLSYSTLSQLAQVCWMQSQILCPTVCVVFCCTCVSDAVRVCSDVGRGSWR